MKTIVIMDWCGERNLQFFVVDGDFEHMDDTYINAGDGNEENQDKLNEWLGSNPEMYDRFPKEVFTAHPNEGIEVITCGFLP